MLSIGVLLCAAGGCSRFRTSFDLVDYSKPGQPKHYRETFNEAYYDVDADGNVDILLRRATGGRAGGGQPVVQVIHIKSFWRSIPGTTVAHDTQINGRVSYCIVSGQVGTALEGAGAVFFRENRREDRLVGTLEQATLRPKHVSGTTEPLFKQAELKGTFRALRDPRRVRRIINAMQCRFRGTTP